MSRDKDSTRKRYLKGSKREAEHRENRAGKQKARKRGEIGQKKARVRRHDWNEFDDDYESFEVMRSQKAIRRDEKANSEHRSVPVEANALVVAVDRSSVLVRLDETEDDLKAESGGIEIAVGDRVEVSSLGDDRLRVSGLAERSSVLTRPDPGVPDRKKVLASNVDLAVCVLSTRRPAFKIGLVDRFLVACRLGEIAPVVVVNKIDLCRGEDELAEISAACERFRELGVPVFLTSAVSNVGVEELRQYLSAKTCVLAGHSGVGKSSLLNTLDPAGARAVGRVRQGDGKGRHTTTRSGLVELADGTRLIDTPGVRAFGLARIEADELRFYFPDLAALGQNCRFKDCRHLNEPDCAVIEAVESGGLDRERYLAYRRILEEFI